MLLFCLTLTTTACGGNSAPATGNGNKDQGRTSVAKSGKKIEVGGSGALIWGSGKRGVVLSHGAAYDAASWTPQADKMAGNGATVLAVEETSQESVQAAAKYLREERGVQSVTLVGASAGSSAVLEAAGKKGVAEQLILLSGTGDVSNLGKFPKLFVASEDEGLASDARRMAQKAPGNRNEALILPGSAHAQAIFKTDQGNELLQRIIKRLRKYG